jgi:hypothetical protein
VRSIAREASAAPAAKFKSATRTLEASFAVARHSGAIAKITNLTSRARAAQLQFSSRSEERPEPRAFAIRVSHDWNSTI